MVMIKISKDLVNLPASLSPDYRPLKGDEKRKATTTHKRRLQLIRNKKYIHHTNYDSRYKTDDIRERLKQKYFHKCAYCEQKAESYHVEHYRPKVIYYWLAFSWDNLLYVCPKCNEYKRDTFALYGSLADFKYSKQNMLNINNLSISYDVKEKPLLVNPEREDPFPLLVFDQNGKISSNDDRMKYTIELCKLDRDSLKTRRKKILDDFKNNLKAEILLHKNKEDQKIVTQALVRQYIEKAKDSQEEFIAFRRYHLLGNRLNNIIKGAIYPPIKQMI